MARRPRKAPSFTSANALIFAVFGSLGDGRIAAIIVNCRACRPWCKAAHRRLSRGRRSTGTCLMTLWFVFALMTAAAIFAVLWPLGRSGRPQREGSEATVYKDQLAEIDRDVAARLIGVLRSRSRARRNQPPAAGRGRSISARRRPHRASGCAAPRRWSRWSGCRSLSLALYLPLGSPRLGDFPLAERTRAPDADAVARQSGGAGRGASGEKSDRWPRLERAGAGAGAGSAATTTRCAPIAIRSPIMATVPSAAPISAKPLPGAAGGVVTAEAKAEFERAVAIECRTRSRRAISSALPPSRTAATPRRRRSGARCWKRRRRMRRGVRWCRPRWRGSAVRRRRRCRTTRWPRQRT